MSWGLIDETGASEYASGLYSHSVLMFGDQYEPEQTETLTGYRIAYWDGSGILDAYVKVAVYDVTDGYESATLVQGSLAQVLALASRGWLEIPLDNPVTLPAGRKYARWFGRGDGDEKTAYSLRAAATNYTRIKSSNVDEPMPVYGVGSSNSSYNYVMEAITSAGSSPSIDPTATDKTLVSGSSHQISFTGLTATPTSVSLVHGGNVFEQPNFSIGAVTEGVATANFTAAVGNLPYTSTVYPASGFSYLVTNDNGTELTLSGITINPSADRSVVTAVNPVNDSFSIIPSWIEGGAVTGDQIDWPKVIGNIEPTVNPDFSHRGDRIDKNIPWPDSIKFTVNYWDSITRIRYAVTVEVAYAEDGTGTVIGITTRELTTRSLTVRNLTMRSL